MITVLFAILVLLLLGVMTAGVRMWTQGGWRPAYVPIVAVLFVGLLALINLAYGHIVVGLLLAGLAFTWATWVWDLEPPSLERLSDWRRRRAQKGRAAPSPQPERQSTPSPYPWSAPARPQTRPSRPVSAPSGFRLPRTGTAPPLERPPTGTSPHRRRVRRRHGAQSTRPSPARLWRALRH